MIEFFDDGHIYLRKVDKVRFLSVSGFLSRYYPPFLEEHWAAVGSFKKIFGADYKEYKNAWYAQGKHLLDPAYIEYLTQFLTPGLVTDAYLDGIETEKYRYSVERDKGAGGGTIVHNDMEDMAYEVGEIITEDDGVVHKVFQKERIPGYNAAVVENLSDLQDAAYPELVVWVEFPKPVYDPVLDCEIGGIAGQADLVLKYTLTQPIARIKDYKTNKELSHEPIFYPNHGPLYWDFPVNYLRDCDIDKFGCQLSTYGLCLELSGIAIEDLEVIHKGNSVPLDYSYYRIAALDMLRHFYGTLSGDYTWLAEHSLRLHAERFSS